jgi:SAM-dependent methyltransferase
MQSSADPVAAYDAVAPVFQELAAGRRAYLDAIDRLVIANSPSDARNLLDIGAGDGRRARLIAKASGIDEVVLLEPSARMRAAGASQQDYVPLRAEELSQVQGSFGLITCLWNVLGHVFPPEARREVLRQCARLLSPKGRLFVDVSHRYNAAHYGWGATSARMLFDLVRPSPANGDVVATWRLGGRETSVRGHVFTDREVRGLVRDAGLRVERRIVVDYRTGAEHQFSLLGNPLYIIRRAPELS